MNLAEAAQLILTLQLKDEVSSGLKGIQGSLDATSKKGATLSGGLGKIGQGLGVGIRNTAKIGAIGLGLLWTQVDAGIDSLVELEDVTNQTEAVIKSTGGAAGLTADDIRELATEMEELSGVDDKVIQSGANVLLTFKEIGQDVFPDAMQAALDMSEAMGTDLQGSIVQIGKALNDPTTGLSALSRVGVTFDEETKKIIEDMVAVGDTAGAQQLIIQELNSEFGGSAQASMEGYRGTQLRLKDTWEELQMTLATALLPALDNLATMLKDKLSDPEVKDGVKKLGEAIAGLFSKENVKDGGDALKDLFTFLKELPWNQIKDGLSFAAENAKKVVDVFRSLPPGVQAGLLTFLAANKLTGGLVASGLGELVKVALTSLRTITAANVTVVGANVVSPGGGVGGIPPVAAAGAAGAGTVGLVSGGALTIVGAAAGGAAATVAYEQFERLWFGPRPQPQLNILHDIAMKEGELTNLQRYANAQTGEQQARLRAQIAELKVQLGQEVAQHQRATVVAAEIRDRVSGVVNRTDHQTQVITGFGADARQGHREAYSALLEQRRLQTIGNHAANEAKDRLASIQVSSQRTAAKEWRVSMTVHTNLNVSGRSIAENISRIERLMGNPDY